MSDEVSETVNENQKLTAQEEQITKPAPKVKPQRGKRPQESRRWEKASRKKQTSKSRSRARIKREIAEKEQENENSAGWFPEMSFQTVLSIAGVAFPAFELYQRFRTKSSSGSAQSPISSREEPKHSGGKAVAKLEAPTSKNLRNVEERRPEQRADERSAAELCSGFASSSKIGMA